MRMYATAETPVIGGVNEGAGTADRLGTSPSLGTHEGNLTAADSAVSRLGRRRWMRRALSLGTSAVLAVSPALAGCGNDAPEARPSVATGQGGGEAESTYSAEQGPCYSDFETLSATDQAECRALIADMPFEDVAKLQGVDAARWVGYYRHEVLESPTVQHLGMREALLDPSSEAYDTGVITRALLASHQADIFTLAWLKQTNAAGANDERTLTALFGSPEVPSQILAAADQVAQQSPAEGQSLDAYRKSLDGAITHYDLFAASDTRVEEIGNGEYTIVFSAALSGPESATVQFTYQGYPYLAETGQGDATKEDVVDEIDKTILGGQIIFGAPSLTANPA